MRLPRLGLSLLLLAPAVAAGQEGSLEAFLRKLRSEREAEFQRLRPRVAELVTKLGTARSDTETRRVRGELEGLGSEVAPLLLTFLDPGAEPTAQQEKSAREVASCLLASKSPALHETLVDLTERGSPKGKVMAVRVLGGAPEPERALVVLRALFPGSTGELRAECVRSLALLGPGEPQVADAIQDDDPAVVRAALEALTDRPHTQALPSVLALAKNPQRAAPVLVPLVRYLTVPGMGIDEDTAVALVHLAATGNLPSESRIAVLDGLPKFGVPLTTKLRREVEPLLAVSDTAVVESALVGLTLLKDSRAKRELLRTHDERVKENERWPKAYTERADVELKIGEYADAAKDYRRALDLNGESMRLPANKDIWVNMARALVLDGKLKGAAEALEEFGLSSELRRELRADPDFLPLLEHSRYKRILE